MIKLQFIFICIAAFTITLVWSIEHCPHLDEDSLQDVCYSQLKGSWKLIASKPEIIEKCMNLTVHGTKNETVLTKYYISKLIYHWPHHVTKSYKIIKHKRSPVLELQNKAWYAVGKEKLQLIGADYEDYALFYSCAGGLIDTEHFQLWTRREETRNSLPKSLRHHLAKFNLKPKDLHFRKFSDCAY